MARRGGSARLCGRIDVVVKADAAVVADVDVVVADGLCRLDAALPPSSRAVRTAPPPPPQLTEEDNMRLSLSLALAEEERKKLRGNEEKKARKAWESRIFFFLSL